MATFSTKIVAGADDGSTDSGSSTLNITAPTIIVGTLGGTQNAFLRYPAVTIPQGATITAATLTFKAAFTVSSLPAFTIYLNNVDNATAPTTYAGFNALALTTTSATYIMPTWIVNNTYVSSDISSVIQEVINRPGWSSGNALMALVYEASTGGSQYRQFYAYETSAADSVALDITYTVGGTAGTITNVSSMTNVADITF